MHVHRINNSAVQDNDNNWRAGFSLVKQCVPRRQDERASLTPTSRGRAITAQLDMFLAYRQTYPVKVASAVITMAAYYYMFVKSIIWRDVIPNALRTRTNSIHAK